jgi:hypothetical protein
MHGRSELEMDTSWNQVGSAEGCTYTECLEMFDEQIQEQPQVI